MILEIERKPISEGRCQLAQNRLFIFVMFIHFLLLNLERIDKPDGSGYNIVTLWNRYHIVIYPQFYLRN